MDKIVRNVVDLPAATRSAVEGLIGHPLRDEQRLYIVALDASLEPSQETRRKAWNDIQPLLDQAAAHAEKSGLSSDEIDSIIDTECERVRYGS